MRSSFWEPYCCKKNNSIKDLPFFHSTELSDYRNIANDYLLLIPKSDDTFYSSPKVFFFYGNPVYFKKEDDGWNYPVILGLEFNRMNNEQSITPTDTGLLVDLSKKEGTLVAKKGLQYFKKESVENVDDSELIPTVNKFIEEWHGTIDNYCSGELKKDFFSKTIDSHLTHEQLYRTKLELFYDSEYLAKHGLLMDIRRKTIELAISRHVNLMQTANLVYAALPRNNAPNQPNEIVLGLMEAFNIKHDMKDKIFHEYECLNDEFFNRSLDEIVIECKQDYRKRFGIEISEKMLKKEQQHIKEKNKPKS